MTGPPSTAALAPLPSRWIAEERTRLAREYPRWDGVHVLSAVLFAFCFGLGTTPLEIGGVPLMVVTALRFPQTWRLYSGLAREPVILALLVFVGWVLLALAWSPDVAKGLDEIGSVRWLWVFVALWPIADRRLPVLAALAAGMLLTHGSQVYQWTGHRLDIPSMTWGRYPDRVSGWNGPIAAGCLLTGMLGLHLAPALLGRGGIAWVARGMALVTGIGLVATGTRGAWVAGAVLVATVTGYAVLARRHVIRGRHVAAGLVLAAAGIGAGWLAVGEGVRTRVDEASREIRGAIEGGDYSTSTGGRIIMWVWAWEAFKAEPVAGVGTGGYRAWVHRQQDARGIDRASQRVLGHAHGAVPHVAAVQGLVGVALFLLVCVLAVVRSLPGPRPGSPYEWGLPFAIVGLLLVGIIDVVHVSTQTSALLALLTALGLGSPRATRRRRR